MKITNLFLTALLFTFSCIGQTNKIQEINIWGIINKDFVDLRTYNIEINEQTFESNCPFYEFEQNKLKCGIACLFAISKVYPEKWIYAANNNLCGTRNTLNGKLRCFSKQLFSSDTLMLKTEMDLYLFYIDLIQLEGPYKEDSEDGQMDFYRPKKNGIVQVFRFSHEMNNWILVQSLMNSEGFIPKVIGDIYMTDVARKNIFEFLNNQNN